MKFTFLFLLLFIFSLVATSIIVGIDTKIEAIITMSISAIIILFVALAEIVEKLGEISESLKTSKESKKGESIVTP